MNLVELSRRTAEGLLATVGIRAGTEEPHHLSTPLTANVELRRYGPRIAAETTVDADVERARNIGFRRLAGYIFGGNHRTESIAMTTPVTQGETIAMTAPVAQRRSTIRFYLPAKWTLDTLPTPDDERVRLVPVPAETVAVLRFSGDRSPRAVATHTTELLDALYANDIEVVGEPQAWFYDPPWTLPCRRRNEVAVPVRG